MSDAAEQDTPFGLLIPERMGSATVKIADQLGGIGILAAEIAKRMLPPKVDRFELIRNLHKMGVKSVGIVAVTALFTGAIMVVQIAPLVTRFGATDIIGWGAGYATLREVGPLLIALMFSGRVGANNTAELATMVVTEQLDALRALAIDPISYLILPRVISMVIMLFMLTIIGDLVALIGAMIASSYILDVDGHQFLNSFFTMLDAWDFTVSLIKASAFGVMIALTSCHFGLTVKGGAPGVGRAVNAAVVAAAIAVFVMDYFSTFIIQ